MNDNGQTIEGVLRARLAAAGEAARLVQPGMLVGLGTGRAASAAIRALGERVRNGELQVTGMATSAASSHLAGEIGIPLIDPDQELELDMTLDGADEVDPALNVIKGGGGALVREKLIAAMSRQLVLIIEEPKQSAHLGQNFRVPVAVIPFAWRSTAARLTRHCAHVSLREQEGNPYATDDGLYVLDLQTGPLDDPRAYEQAVRSEIGVVEVGLFVGLCSTLVVGCLDGSVRTHHRSD